MKAQERRRTKDLQLMRVHIERYWHGKVKELHRYVCDQEWEQTDSDEEVRNAREQLSKAKIILAGLQDVIL